MEILIVEDWELENLGLEEWKSGVDIDMVVCETLLCGVSPVTF